MDKQKIIALAQEVFDIEGQAILSLKSRIDDSFVKACELIEPCEGRLVITGMGKSGHIGNKLAATFASTGTPAFFVHPGEAGHGDLGMIKKGDVVLALSNSGETDEVISIIPVLKRFNIPLLSMTGRPQSTLAQSSDVHLDVSIEKEACPLGLAPTTSTTVTLAMGDALAVALLENKGFTAEDFALSHPSGSLGRKLLLHVNEIMSSGKEMPIVKQGEKLSTVLLEISKKGLGMCMIQNTHQQLAGIFTDGDLRRTLDNISDIHHTIIDDVMTSDCTHINANALAVEALALMEEKSISALPVVDKNNVIIGAINMHHLLRSGVV